MNSSRQAGITIMELLITMTVAGILMAIAVPNMTAFIRNNRLTGGVNDMLHSFQVARTEAIKRQNGNVVVCGTATPDVADNAMACDYATFKAWFVFHDVNMNWQHDAGEPILERHGLLDATVTVRTDANDRIVSYNPSGFSNPAAARRPMTTAVLCDARTVQQVGANATGRALFITVTGRVRASNTWTDVSTIALPLVGGACP